jgi:hypothetical protein
MKLKEKQKINGAISIVVNRDLVTIELECQKSNTTFAVVETVLEPFVKVKLKLTLRAGAILNSAKGFNSTTASLPLMKS